MPTLSSMPAKLANRLYENLNDMLGYIFSICDEYIDKGCNECPFKKTRFEEKYECDILDISIREFYGQSLIIREIVEILEKYENAKE